MRLRIAGLGVAASGVLAALFATPIGLGPIMRLLCPSMLDRGPNTAGIEFWNIDYFGAVPPEVAACVITPVTVSLLPIAVALGILAAAPRPRARRWLLLVVPLLPGSLLLGSEIVLAVHRYQHPQIKLVDYSGGLTPWLAAVAAATAVYYWARRRGVGAMRHNPALQTDGRAEPSV